jgi:hypothetical protein
MKINGLRAMRESYESQGMPGPYSVLLPEGMLRVLGEEVKGLGLKFEGEDVPEGMRHRAKVLQAQRYYGHVEGVHILGR